MPSVRCKRVVSLAQPPVSECVEITRTVVVVEGIIDELLGIDVESSEAALIVIPPGVMTPEQTLRTDHSTRRRHWRMSARTMYVDLILYVNY
jgi:hypothetical protein